jgi:putative acetyltransferase
LITIRDYQGSDAKALWDIHFHTIRNVNIRDYSQAQVEAWAPDISDNSVWLKRMKGLDPYVAILEELIVGYADLQYDGYIDHFFCHGNHQGKGIGKSLMQKIIFTAKSKGIERLYSHVSITAKPFFEHFGFQVLTEQQVEIRGQVLTNYVMEKSV